LVKGDIAMHIPPNISFEEAATLGGGLATVGLAMYKHLGWPFPTFPLPTPTSRNSESENKKTPILIYGEARRLGRWLFSLQSCPFHPLLIFENVIRLMEPKDLAWKSSPLPHPTISTS
jgi:hypothetical protein